MESLWKTPWTHGIAWSATTSKSSSLGRFVTGHLLYWSCVVSLHFRDLGGRQSHIFGCRTHQTHLATNLVCFFPLSLSLPELFFLSLQPTLFVPFWLCLSFLFSIFSFLFLFNRQEDKELCMPLLPFSSACRSRLLLYHLLRLPEVYTPLAAPLFFSFFFHQDGIVLEFSKTMSFWPSLFLMPNFKMTSF